jgi:hypothetical protein
MEIRNAGLKNPEGFTLPTSIYTYLIHIGKVRSTVVPTCTVFYISILNVLLNSYNIYGFRAVQEIMILINKVELA